MSRILFIGDPHIRPDNTEEVDILIHEIERACTLYHYDMIVVGGDVMHYHERVFTQALNKALEFIDKMRKIAPTYVLVGNHDAINNSIFLTDHHWMNALKKWDDVYIVDHVLIKDDVVMCPYVAPGRFIEAIETKLTSDEWMKKSIFFAHQEFKGCKMGAIISEHGDEWEDDYPIVVSGHIHDHQKVSENIYYPGTPLQHSFGDSDVRVLASILLENNESPVITFLPLNVPKKQIIKTTMKNLSECMSSSRAHKNIKIKLDASSTEFSAFKQTSEYKELIKKGVKIQLVEKKKMYNDNDKNDKNDNDKNDEQSIDFTKILTDLVKNDDEIVNHLYHELFVNELVI